MYQSHDESHAELRERAARIRSFAWDFVGLTISQRLFWFADELDAQAIAMETITAVRVAPADGSAVRRRGHHR